MNFRLTTALATVGTLAAVATSAHAADIIEPMPQPIPVEKVSTSGWYLRGDVGYVFEEETSGEYRYYSAVDGSYDRVSYDSIETDEAFMVGGGLGYRLNEYARFDLTADYFSTDLEGSSACYQTSFSECSYDDRSELDIWTIMANAYVDIGTYWGMTPYVGGGLGVAHVNYGDLKNTFDCDSGPVGTKPCGDTFTHEGYSEWRFAASLMAGFSYAITHQLFFDAGYKYTYIADGEAFGFDSIDRAGGASGVQGYDDSYELHTLRAGLRYEFGGGGYGKGKAPVYEPLPVYAEAPVYK